MVAATRHVAVGGIEAMGRRLLHNGIDAADGDLLWSIKAKAHKTAANKGDGHLLRLCRGRNVDIDDIVDMVEL
jgi:hypothetical protein